VLRNETQATKMKRKQEVYWLWIWSRWVGSAILDWKGVCWPWNECDFVQGWWWIERRRSIK